MPVRPTGHQSDRSRSDQTEGGVGPLHEETLESRGLGSRPETRSDPTKVYPGTPDSVIP